jgi:hypothetical protein
LRQTPGRYSSQNVLKLRQQVPRYSSWNVLKFEEENLEALFSDFPEAEAASLELQF